MPDAAGNVAMLWLSAAAVLFGYFLGSLPTAHIVARRQTGADIRRLGDGNPGAGNIGRLFGRRWGITVAAADILKGAIPVFAANLLTGAITPDGIPSDGVLSNGIAPPTPSTPAMLAGAAAIAGHLWPIWTRGRGGRGAATALGVTSAIMPLPVLLAAPPAIAILLATRSTTLALAFLYLAALIAGPTLFAVPWHSIAYCVGIFLAVGAAHWWAVLFRDRPAKQSDGG